jgi:hypothetical protein
MGKYCLEWVSIIKVLSGTLFSLPGPREGFEPSTLEFGSIANTAEQLNQGTLIEGEGSVQLTS